jgi:serine protease AprX
MNMRRQKIFRTAALPLLALATLVFASLRSAPPSSAARPPADLQAKVDPRVLDQAALGRAEFLIYMRQQADLSGADSLATKEEKGRYVYERLTATAGATQAGVRQTLELLGAEYQPFWISNLIHAKGDLAVVQAVAALPEVAAVHPVGRGELRLPEGGPSADAAGGAPEAAASSSADPDPEPALALVNADEAWAMGIEGQGVVVAGADTGVRWTHAALRRQYRGWDGSAASHDYNWHDGIHAQTWPPDPANLCNGGGTPGQRSPEPCDDDELLGGGHGSHTVGSMIGDDGGANRIGMAPRAQWIACRNMSRGVGAIPSYLECMQWFLAPTKIDGTDPDPAKAPHVINNSWGCIEGCPTDPNPLRNVLRASRAAGIIYVASAGNDGPLCNTIFHPLARYPEAFTVGSTTHTTDLISSFSSRGPAAADPENLSSLTYVKPNVTAPGSSIRSSLRGSDGQYGSLSGTSMAGPHVAGLVALLISANPRLAGEVSLVEDIIERTAVRKTTTEGCGGDTAAAVPNNTYGWGRIDALKAVLHALAPAAANDTAATVEATAVRIDVLANDADPNGDPLTITSVGPASRGTVVNNGDGTLTYVPAAGFTGVDTFVYTICAPDGCKTTSSTAAVTVTVNRLRGGKKK